jgi:hypothetical protein
MLASGTRMTINWANGETGAITYHADGSADAETEGKSARGSWKIKVKKLCLNWTSNDSQTDQCYTYTIYRDKEGSLKLYNEERSLSAKATIPSVSS